MANDFSNSVGFLCYEVRCTGPVILYDIRSIYIIISTCRHIVKAEQEAKVRTDMRYIYTNISCIVYAYSLALASNWIILHGYESLLCKLLFLHFEKKIFGLGITVTELERKGC